ncbi:OB-fold-containig protein [Pontibacter beigongshangensis]|uniref:OB-fold-containig protein n=1 Tax=Pontibacter beigongshangensis TaxID=2574733 RepID=UPI00165018DB|nr:OB-fold-containig protein [Pontibacter beigongshangensis]
MSELLEAAFSSVNLIPTALLVFVMLYWFAVIFGLLDLQFFDMEVEKEFSTSAESVSAVSWLNSALAFFNLGRIPFMLFLTFLVLPLWVMSVLANHYLDNSSGLLALLLLVPAFFASLFVSKILTTPFIKLFDALEKEHLSTATIIGQICTVIIAANAHELGQATIKSADGLLLLNVKTPEGQSLRKGDTAVVLEYNEQSKYYLIEPYQTN